MNFICAWCLFDDYTSTFIADGDSLTNGIPTMTPWRVFLPAFTPKWANLNFGVGAQTCQTIAGIVSSKVVPEFKPGGGNVYVLWCGTNDGAAGRTANQAWNDAVTASTLVRAAGFKTIFVTMISRNGLDTFKNQLNTLALANWPGNFDAIVDMTGISQISADGAFSNTTYFVDGIHSTTLANQTLEEPAIYTVASQFF